MGLPSSEVREAASRCLTESHPLTSQPSETQYNKHKIVKKYVDNLLVWYTNADTLTSEKMNELKTRIDIEHPDVICITEAYPKNCIYTPQDAFFEIEGYNPPLKTEYAPPNRGILIYTANHILGSHILPNTQFNESLWCNIKLNSSKNNIIIGTIYRSPSSTCGNNELLIDLLNEIDFHTP